MLIRVLKKKAKALNNKSTHKQKKIRHGYRDGFFVFKRRQILI